MNLLSVLQPTPPEIWKQISGVKVPVEKSRKRPANGHTYVKGPYTNIDDLILKMEVGKTYQSKDLAALWGHDPKSVHKARTRLLVKYPSEVEAFHGHDDRGHKVTLLKRVI